MFAGISNREGEIQVLVTSMGYVGYIYAGAKREALLIRAQSQLPPEAFSDGHQLLSEVPGASAMPEAANAATPLRLPSQPRQLETEKDPERRGALLTPPARLPPWQGQP